jgi:heme o synthase
MTTTTTKRRAEMGLSAAATAGGEASASLARSIANALRVYHDLSKFKLSAFVVSTAAAGYVLGSGERVDWEGLGWTSLGTMLCSASANTFNQVFEVKNDSVMARTMRRPLPAKRCSVAHAATFGVLAGLAGVGVLTVKANNETAALGAFNIALYALCYTPLKQMHWLNTWAGAVVGAIPPVMGWCAARGAIEPAAGVLAAALYYWQMPHFMALAYMARDDYVRRVLSHTGPHTTASAW